MSENGLTVNSSEIDCRRLLDLAFPHLDSLSYIDTVQQAESWPTSEMSGRGTWQNLMVGLPVAFFSGLGGEKHSKWIDCEVMPTTGFRVLTV